MAVYKNGATKIGIIGGGHAGLSLINIFSGSELAKVEFIVDLDEKAPGIVEARRKGINTYKDIPEALKVSSVNFVFEATGSGKVLSIIHEHLPEGVEVVSSSSALLLYGILDAKQRLANQVISEVGIINSEIGQNVREIGDFAGNIDYVARTLNMLSINARIEATHAGKYGKAFSVVAEEVNRSAGYTKEMAEKIFGINEKILEVSGKLNSSLDRLK